MFPEFDVCVRLLFTNLHGHKLILFYLLHLYTATPREITVITKNMRKVAIDKIIMIVCEEETVMRTRVYEASFINYV